MLTLTKFANVVEAIVGDEILYTITVNNTSGMLLTSVIVTDLLAAELDFVEGSIEVGGFPRATDNILTGVEVGPIGIGSTLDVTFKAKVVSRGTGIVANQATITYTYTDPLDGLVKLQTEETNTNEINVEIAEVNLTKEADVTSVGLGDLIHYRVTLENTGTIGVVNVILKDQLPESVTLVADSVMVDGVNVNDPDFEAGINVGSIGVGGTVVVDYTVRVISGTCSGYIENKAIAVYNYVLPNSATGIKTSNEVSVKVSVNITAFKQLSIDKYFKIPTQKPNIEDIDDVAVEIYIEDSYVVNTIQKTSNEGQQLSGYKLIIHGYIKMSVEYTALLPDQPMHSAHSSTPFSTFIILPMDYEGGEIEVSSILEDVTIDRIDLRGVDVGVVFLVIAQIK